MEIPDHLHFQIKELCAEGDVLVEMGEFTNAHKNYTDAFLLVPEPKQSYYAATWILAAIADAHFKAKSYAQAETVLSDAMHCADAIGNPFLHLRLGQVALELGNQERAADELCRAYMGAGRKIFEAEDQKYFAFLKSRIAPPAGGEW